MGFNSGFKGLIIDIQAHCWTLPFTKISKSHHWSIINARTSTESNLVTPQSTAHEPPEDGRKYGPKHVGATSLECFNMLLSVLNINVN